MSHINIQITPEMLDAANEFAPRVAEAREFATRRSQQTFLIGEFAFAQWLFNDWERHNFRETNCQSNFMDSTEIRSSACPFRDTLHIFAKQPYVNRRNADYYVCVIIDTPTSHVDELQAGLICKICGWATDAEIKSSDLKDALKADGRPAGYQSYYRPIGLLHPMNEFPLL